MCGTIKVITAVTGSDDIGLVWHSEKPAYNRIVCKTLDAAQKMDIGWWYKQRNV